MATKKITTIPTRNPKEDLPAEFDRVKAATDKADAAYDAAFAVWFAEEKQLTVKLREWAKSANAEVRAQLRASPAGTIYPVYTALHAKVQIMYRVKGITTNAHGNTREWYTVADAKQNAKQFLTERELDAIREKKKTSFEEELKALLKKYGKA